MYKNPPLLFAVGLNYKSAPLEIREKMFLRNDDIPPLLDAFKNILSECMIISTCNRTELYGVTENEELQIDAVKKMLIEFNTGLSDNKNYFYEFLFSEAASHLFKVAASIDSMVVGDTQIMHQVKEAYQIANNHGSIGKILNQLVQKALHAGKRSKNETELFEGAFSVSYAAVELAMKIFGSLAGKRVMVIGAGKTSELTICNLAKKNVSNILVTNRTKENAEKLVQRLSDTYSVEAAVIGFDVFKSVLNQIDIVISSTGSGKFILNYGEFKETAKERRGRPLLIIDIAVPRDIDPAINGLGNVFLKNIDDLNAIVDSNYDKRISVIPEVTDIIRQEVADFLNWYYTIPVLPAIQHIQKNYDGRGLEEIKKIRSHIAANVSIFQTKQQAHISFESTDIKTVHQELVRELNDLNTSILNK